MTANRSLPRLMLTCLIAFGAGCSGLVDTGAAGECDNVVRVGDVVYRLASFDTLDGFTPGESHGTVQSHRECVDGVVDGEPASAFEPLGDRESNFLPAGTPLHRVGDSPPGEQLVAWWDELDGWVRLVPKDVM